MLIRLMTLLRGIGEFSDGSFKEMQRLFNYLSKGQHPEVLFVTCSDSRLDPNLFTQSEPGTFFNIRNVGNIIPPSTVPSSEAAAIEYAVTGLNVTNIIVCGHSQCGAIAELLYPEHTTTLPSLTAWLAHARPVAEQMNQEYPDMEYCPLKKEIANKKNVLTQIEHLKTYPIVAEKIKQGKLTLNAWYYQFETGEVFIYNSDNNGFIRFDIALKQSIDECRKLIVNNQAIAYLRKRSDPQTIKQYGDLMYLLSQLKFNLEPIWQHIKDPIAHNLWSELGGLYSGLEDPKFMELVAQSSTMIPTNFKDLHENIEKSKGYHKYCSQLIRDSGFLKPILLNQKPQSIHLANDSNMPHEQIMASI